MPTLGPRTLILIALGLLIAYIVPSTPTARERMIPNLIRQISKSFSAAPHTMVKKTPPPPTVPAAIRSAQEAKPSEGIEYATFASGCFWGTEELFQKYYSHLPQWTCKAGYTGGDKNDPFCSGETGHAEAVRIGYQKGSVGFGELVEFFYRTHDPTTKDRQGNDRGTQYRSAIFYHSPEQEQVAKAVTKEVQEMHMKDRPIVTQIVQAGQWWDAEDYHQNYLENNPFGYRCESHRLYW